METQQPTDSHDSGESMTVVEPSSWALMVLSALNKKPAGAVYLGTVPGHVKALRRARGKVAKASRKLNRG